MDTKKLAKKRPGRPRKKPLLIQQEICGIVQTPQNENSMVELVYYNPRMFKKIITLLSALSVNEVYISFLTNRVEIITIDHFQKSLVVIKIIGDKLNSYFCKNEVEIGIKQATLKKIFKTVDKSHDKITFLLDNDTHKNNLTIIIHNSELQKDDQYDAELINVQKNFDTTRENFLEYPISFILNSDLFRKTINNIAANSDTFSFEKAGIGPLQIVYQSPKSVSLCSSFNDSEKIKLKSSIDNDDIFAVSVRTDYIKQFASSTMGDEVRIYADTYKRLVLVSVLDGGTCVIQNFTKIVNNQI